jgi:uncharacterized protein YdhG (YjbR/CyaY superfamily)
MSTSKRISQRRWRATERIVESVATTVEEYVEGLGAPQRRLFEQLQALILDELPEAEIVISYQIPLYKVGKLHVGLSARRAGGVTLTTTSSTHIEAFKERHPQFKTNKASIQFDIGDELPEADIRDVVRRAVAT